MTAFCTSPDSSDADVYVCPAGVEDIPAVVQIHLSAFSAKFTLSALGPKFLSKYYRQVQTFDGGILLLAKKGNETIGFVAGFVDPPRFYKTLSRHKWQFVIPALLAVPKHPSLLLRVGALVHRAIFPQKRLEEGSHAPCELSSVAVQPSAACRGCGKTLVLAFAEAAKAKNAFAVSLTTDATNNDAVNRFYQRLGFRLYRSFQASKTRTMNEYVLDLPRGA